jgi:dTDP-4-amino-4,6-dideoxygalactose transaminase
MNNEITLPMYGALKRREIDFIVSTLNDLLNLK